jgi:phytoene dehydrogenase-like protein
MRTRLQRYDVIIIGAGPNGLAIGAYLSKAGLKVLLVERRHEVGGGLATEEVTLPGYLHNTHALYMMMVDYAPIYADFTLEERYDVKHIYPSLQFALPLSDGRCVCLYSDPEKTCESLARFSGNDAEAYRMLYNRLTRYVDEFLAAATYSSPVPPLDQLVRLQQTEVGREIAEISEKTPREIVDAYFENEHIKTLMLYVATKWGISYDQPGLGYLVALYLNRATNYRLVRGGSHVVAQALHRIIHNSGGVALNNQRVRRIIIENDTATGIEMEDGTRIHADKAIVSTIDPHQTFLKLVSEENLEREFAEKIKAWQWERYSIFGVHLALEEAPDFKAAASNPEINRSLVYVLGYESPKELMDEYQAIHGGELREEKKTGLNCCFPSLHDTGQAPKGRCTGVLYHFAPYALKGGVRRWTDIRLKEEMAERCLATLRIYAPNMTEEKVLWKYVSTPMDVENKFKNMVRGGYKQGLYHPLQMGYLRPNEDCSRNRTPIRNLYLGGSSAHPGGCIIWGPGYLAANCIADELGLKKWWSEPGFVTRAREAGLLV